MFQGKNIVEILMLGGFTMVVMIICSISSLTVILERVIYYFKNSRINRADFMVKLKTLLKNEGCETALKFCEGTKAPFARVSAEGIKMADSGLKSLENAMERQISLEVKDLEKYTNILGTIGGTVVYIGLFGTVLGIIKAFQDIALSAGVGAGMSAVITGIAEALISTATGIFIAVPSVMAYNFLMKKIENMTLDMELCGSEISDFFRAK
jgi:biopolymer transport protein ExbB